MNPTGGLSRLPLKPKDAVGPLTQFYDKGEDSEDVELLLVQLTEEVNGSAHYEFAFSDWENEQSEGREERDLDEIDRALRRLDRGEDLDPALEEALLGVDGPQRGRSPRRRRHRDGAPAPDRTGSRRGRRAQ